MPPKYEDEIAQGDAVITAALQDDFGAGQEITPRQAHGDYSLFREYVFGDETDGRLIVDRSVVIGCARNAANVLSDITREIRDALLAVGPRERILVLGEGRFKKEPR